MSSVSKDADDSNILVRLPEKTLQAQQDTLYVQHRTPLVLQDVQTDPATEVEVGVVDWSLEKNRRRCVRVVRGKGKGELEGEVGVRGVCGSKQGGGPEEQRATRGEGRDSRSGGHHQTHEFGL